MGTIFAVFVTANPINNKEEEKDYRLELPSRSGRRVSTEHEPHALLRKSRDIDFKNALFNSLDESGGLDTSTYRTTNKRKRGKGRKGKKGKKGRKGRKNRKNRKGKKNKKSRRNRKNRKNKKGGRRRKNRIPKMKK